MTDFDLGSGVPSDRQAEEALLAIVLQAPTVFRSAAVTVGPDDFYLGAHAACWQLFTDMAEAGTPQEPALVMAAARASSDGTVQRFVPDLLLRLTSRFDVVPASVGHYAAIVVDLSLKRAALRVGQRIAQGAVERDASGAEIVEWAAEQIRTLRDDRRGVDVLTRPVEEFLADAPEDVDWVVPDLLGRGDRFVLTGSGGIGKSTLLRQIAVMSAAGLHPLDWQPMDPIRVTVVDVENSNAQNQVAYRQLAAQVRSKKLDLGDRLRIGGNGNPLDLLNPQNAMSLLRTIEHDQPDLVVIGPAYKLHTDDPDKEAVVKQLLGVLDSIRAMGAAILTEAHASKAGRTGNWEPSGSNVWTWWPEIGRALVLDQDSDPILRRCALKPWRGDRVHRQWPEFLEHGGTWHWATAA